ncbi:MAG TPA: CPBP family glutamic-type intramembrane protease [Candidatus Limnocylindrales bacterium]|nr:CPBP family glutamic-type intramembrane protease [Candidatus Limnocylindrales bacterium]
MIPEPFGNLIVVGLALLLIMLRLDAERFGAAEYDEASRDGHLPSFRRRMAWYILGVALVIAILVIHPRPREELFLGAGDRVKALVYGLIFGVIGAAQAVAFARLRYHHFRLPDVRSYPGALVNSVATAFIDEATFRGALFGILLLVGLNPTLANVAQALVYALATRLGAPGRDRYMLVLTVLIGLAGGWLTAATGGIAAAFLGHAVTRFSVFLCTGHAGQVALRGREREDIERRRKTPEGWRIIGSR